MRLAANERRPPRPALAACALAVFVVVGAGSLLGAPGALGAGDVPAAGRAASSTPAPWRDYEARFDSWRRALAAQVDAPSSARPADLPPPLPRTLWRAGGCARTEADLRGCYRAVVAWRNEVEAWLGRRGVVGSGAAALPRVPRRRLGTPVEARLTRALAGLFDLTVASRAHAGTRRRVRVSFDAPLSSAAALRLLVAIGASRDVDLVGTFVGSGSVITAGRVGRGLVTHDPTTSIADRIEALYRDQLQGAAAVRRDLAGSRASARSRRDVAQAAADLARYRGVLQRRAPFVSGFTAEVDVPELLATIAATGSRVTSATSHGSGPDAVTPTVRATVRESAGMRANARAAASDAPPPASAYMPSTWLARTHLTGPPNRFKWHMKQTNLLFRWKAASRLAYYQGAAAGQRGFEAQASPYTGRPWSRFWVSWSSNMPSAYQDDLTSDRPYKVFAIGSGNGRALKANTLYWANYKTDAQYPSTDEGRVQLSGQAVRRAATTRERGYCLLRGGADRYCFFGAATSIVGTYPIGSRYHAFP